MNLINNINFTFCNQEEETITHHVWECNTVKILKYLKTDLVHILNIPDTMNCKSLILGSTGFANEKMNILSLEVKKNIFACRRKKTLANYNGLLKSLSGAYSIYNNINLTETEKERWSVVKEIVSIHN